MTVAVKQTIFLCFLDRTPVHSAVEIPCLTLPVIEQLRFLSSAAFKVFPLALAQASRLMLTPLPLLKHH